MAATAAAGVAAGAAHEEYCPVLLGSDRTAVPQENEIIADLESSDVERKIGALKKTILLLIQGEELSRVFMTVIRYCITAESHELQKLLMVYWEVVKKYDAAGKLREEMILVCNAVLKNLNHPNEYIRGSTLRFLCRVRERELLEPLKHSILENLKHRHHYVRRNAVNAVHNIYRVFGEDFLPGAPDDILRFMDEESDQTARRNAFAMLFNCAQDKAVAYFVEHSNDVATYGDGFSLVVLELARKACRADPSLKPRFVKAIFQMLSSESSALVYEAASTLTSMSQAPTAVRAAAAAYTGLLASESDNNVKLIVLERIDSLRKRHTKVLRELVMDVLRALSSPNEAIQRKTLDIAMALVGPRNVEEVMLLLKKELVATQEAAASSDKDGKYRQMLVEAIHTITARFPEIAHSVVHLLLEFMSADGGLKVAMLVREIVESYPALRSSVMPKLVEGLSELSSSDVFRVVLWIVGEYCEDDVLIASALAQLSQCLGRLPLHKPVEAKAAGGAGGAAEEGAGEGAAAAAGGKRKGPAVLADGTYASQSAADFIEPKTEAAAAEAEEALPPLRRLLLKGDYFVGAALASTLTKLALRTASLHGSTSNRAKAVMVDSMLVMCAIVELGQAKGAKHPIDQDAYERIVACMRIIADPESQAAAMPVLLNGTRAAFAARLKRIHAAKPKDADDDDAASKPQADQLLTVRQLRGRVTGVADAVEIGLDDEADVMRAAGAEEEDFASRLSRVHQLSGFADPVYVEAFVTVHDYDITLEIILINRTEHNMTNVVVELHTMGALKVVDRPSAITLGPGDTRTIKANIKVSATEAGHIFGNVAYDSTTSAEKTIINLRHIHIDIMDYINPATTSDEHFREMWADFEWENKVAVHTDFSSLKGFVRHMVKSTNMKCLTPIDDLSEDCNFMAANLYARSIFGEDALVNVSVEVKPDGGIRGHIRIRSKTQGVALSLGDKMSASQSLPK
mmetsp:Transcript_8319/g.29537  ORF Transcript_8319/g.29537 Transcript_8319/m.29537 type:complete len:971 (-) Transcript_8319:106-3018(-)